MTYHLHTEDRANLGSIVAVYFGDGFTIEHATGYWHGQSEPAAIIEIETADHDKINRLAARIKIVNNQQAILIESYNTSSTLV